jgi:hypothetical protein
MAVAYQTPAAIIRGQMSVGRKSFGNLGFDSLGKQGTRPIAQSFGQRIGAVTRLAQGDDLIVFHGVSILICICGWLTPPLIRRLPFPAPSPTFLDSSPSFDDDAGFSDRNWPSICRLWNGAD